MSKMTREERKAAGWETRGWAVRYPVSNNQWRWARDTMHVDAPRRVFMSDSDAHREASFWGGAKLVRLWHRKKPAAPPPLKVGDEVLVRAKVVAVRDHDRTASVELPTSGRWALNACDIVRAAKGGT